MRGSARGTRRGQTADQFLEYGVPSVPHVCRHLRHCIGERATEIIHIGQAVIFYSGSVKFFRDMVFNYPTLAEAHKVAALDGLNKI